MSEHLQATEIHFRRLRYAYYDLMLCRISSALEGYRSITKADGWWWRYRQSDGHWLLSADPDGVGLNNVCVYFGAYAIQRRQWEVWQQLYTIVRAQTGWADFPADQRLHLHALNGWGSLSFRSTNTKLDEIIRNHLIALKTPGLSRLTTALHHMVLAQAYRQRRDLGGGLKHLDEADDLLSWEDEPFYALFNLEHRGDLHYFLHTIQPGFAERALTIYEEAEVKTRQYTGGVDFTAHAYNIGWVYAETQRYDLALSEFKRCMNEAKTMQDEHLFMQCMYGMGYVYCQRDEYDLAEEHLLRALGYFQTESSTYCTVILTLLVAIYQRTNPVLAAERLRDAYHHTRKISHPVYRHHILRLMTYHYLRSWDIRFIPQLFSMVALRLRYNIPLWPP